MKKVPKNNPGLSKLPTPVRNKMGYLQEGGGVTETIKGNRGTKENAMRKFKLLEERRKKEDKRLEAMEAEYNKSKEESGSVMKAKGGSVCGRPTGQGFGAARRR